MACFKYTITNLGNDKAFGEYIQASTNQSAPWYCHPGMSIHLNDVMAGTITGDDPGYFYGYVVVAQGDPCGAAPTSTCTVDITEVITTANTAQRWQAPNGAAQIEISDLDPSLYEFSIGGQFWQASNVFGGLANGSYTAWVRKKADPTCFSSEAFTIAASIPFLFGTAKVLKNESKGGAADGEIQVQVVSGSGSYSVHFNHDNSTVNLTSGNMIQTMVKEGLSAREYTITITDIPNGATLVIKETITAPVVARSKPGTKLEVPFMNSIHYVIEDMTEPQTPDNRLLINQKYPGFQPVNYSQKIVKTRYLTTQFNTDYKNARAELFEYGSDKWMKTFPAPILKKKNIGETEDHPVQIWPHHIAGFSRVYFATGAPRVPFTVGVPFEILNNAEGYNGIYDPVGVYLDPNRGYEYAVIKMPWTQPGGIDFVTATGRFEVSVVDFNVYEIPHTFNEIPNGCYYVKLTAFDADSSLVARSEPLDIQDKHENCLLIEARNVDNAFGLAFSFGYTIVLWIPGLLGHKRRPGGERVTSRNSDYSLVKVSAKKQRTFDLETFMLPPWLHEKLSVLFDCDFYTINGVPYQTTEGYGDPAYIYKFLLANSSVRVEQVAWLDKYNSDDAGTVADIGGFISANGGLIRK